MGLNLSSLQIAKELDMDRNDVLAMIQQLRQGIVDRCPPVVLEGEVECDEVYVVAGHKGNPEVVKKRSPRPSQAIEGGARSRNFGEREAADFRHDSARRSGDDPDVGECQAGHN
jgi:hypothetical protein